MLSLVCSGTVPVWSMMITQGRWQIIPDSWSIPRSKAFAKAKRGCDITIQRHAAATQVKICSETLSVQSHEHKLQETLMSQKSRAKPVCSTMPQSFYRATRMHNAHYAVARCLSPSVRTSIRLSHAGILSKRLNISSKFLHHRVAPPF